MKGTIFSSDFCIDESNNVRLLEINTDTAFITTTLGSEVNVAPIINMMTGSIDSVYVVYKDAHHANFVEYLSQSVATAHSHSFTAIAEQIDSIYPTVPTDAANKFIIRLAYDENAILDSTYAKGKFNLLNLFNDQSNADSVVEFYYSSSATGVIDNIDKTNFSPNNVIDAVTKKATEAHQTMRMYKIGHPASSSADRWDNFINTVKTEDSMIQQYYYNADELEDSKITSIRQFTYVYGSDLEQVSLGCYKAATYFDLPTTLNDNYDHRINNMMGTYYKYCFATNHIAEATYGVSHFESLISSSGTFIAAADVSASNEVLSYFVSGSPQDNDNWYDWSYAGTSLPGGSHATGSTVISTFPVSSSNNLLTEIILSTGDTVYTSPNEAFLVRNEIKDVIEWEYALNLYPTSHSVWVSGSGFTSIAEGNTGVTVADVQYEQINVEDEDAYQLSGSNVIVHNAPCFVEGTIVTIRTGEGDLVQRPIESLKLGEQVLSYNLDNEAQEYKGVTKIQTKENQDVVQLSFSNNSEVTCTYDHPFFVSGSSWSAYTPSLSEHTDRALAIGDKCLHKNGEYYTISAMDENEDTSTVYNLDEIADNNNFFAGGFLVHNRAAPCCFVEGTEITLGNGDVKNIENIVVGDIVETWTEEGIVSRSVLALEPTVVGDRELYTIKGDGICNIEFTPEHPFLTQKGWKAIEPLDLLTGELQVGDSINCCKEWKEIKTITTVDTTPETKVYNFTVSEHHNYIANGIVVHNK